MSRFKSKYRLMRIIALVVMFLSLARNYTMAASPGNVTVSLDNANVTFYVYQVGTLEYAGNKWNFEIGEDFVGSGFDIALFEQTSSKQVEKALEMQRNLEGKTITPYQKGTSDTSNKVVFGNLAEGVYLFVKDDDTAANVLVDPFFVTVPLREEEGEGYAYEFTCEPKSQLTTITTELEVTKKLLHGVTDEELSVEYQYEFQIKLQSGDASAVMIPNSTVTSDSTSDMSAAIKFAGIEFTKAGTYQFVITELRPSDYHPDHAAVSYDPGEIIATVEVKEEDRLLKVSSQEYEKWLGEGSKYHYDETEEDTTFVNYLLPDHEKWTDTVVFRANKQLTGRNPRMGEFQFTSSLIYSSTEISMADAIAQNNAAGEITFPAQTFGEAGTYIFRISENIGTDTSILYDSTVYYARVDVTEARTGELKSEVIYGSSYDENTKQVGGAMLEVPVFQNTLVGYINIKKVSYTNNRPLTGAQFTISYRKIESSENWTKYGEILETTGDDGSIKLDLPDDYWIYEYQLIETRAPSGYSSARVGTIVFTMNVSGRIESWSSTGTGGYVEVSEDGTTLTAKNYTTGGGGGDTDPTTSPNTTSPTSSTDPTESTGPTESTSPTYPTVVVPPDVPLIPYTPGDLVPEGKQVVVVIDEDGVPRTYLIDEGLVPLARTGDLGISIAALILMMGAALGGFLLILYKRSKTS